MSRAAPRRLTLSVDRLSMAYQELIAGTTIGIAILDAHGTIHEANAALHGILGLPAGALIGTNWAALLPEEDAASASRLFSALRDGVQTHDERLVRLRARSGTLAWVRVAATLLRGDGGLPAVGAIVRDVTDQVAQMRRQEALFRFARRTPGGDARSVLDRLFDEAIAAFEADAGLLCRWDAEREVLVPERATLVDEGTLTDVPSGSGVAGLAFRESATVIINDYQTHPAVLDTYRVAGITRGMGTPLIHEGVKLGAISVGRRGPSQPFDEGDARTFELLATMAAAEIAELRLGRLNEVLAFARRAEHDMGSTMAMTVGYAELLANDPTLHEETREMAREILSGALESVSILRRLEAATEQDARFWETGPPQPAGGTS